MRMEERKQRQARRFDTLVNDQSRNYFIFWIFSKFLDWVSDLHKYTHKKREYSDASDDYQN